MSILFVTPKIIIIAMAVGLVLAIKKIRDGDSFSGELAETDGTLTSINIRRLNYQVYINEYDYTYVLNGQTYTGHDTESFWLKQKRNPMPSGTVRVEYSRNKPAESRLKMIDHKNDRKRLVIATVIAVLCIMFLSVF